MRPSGHLVALLILCLAAAAPAQAGLITQWSISDPKMGNSPCHWFEYDEADRMAVVWKCPAMFKAPDMPKNVDENTRRMLELSAKTSRMVFDGKAQANYMVSDELKSYQKTTEQDIQRQAQAMKAMVGDMGGIVDRMKQAFSQGGNSKNPAAAKFFQNLLRKSEAQSKKREVTTGRMETFNSWRCSITDTYQGDSLISESCIARPQTVGVDFTPYLGLGTAIRAFYKPIEDAFQGSKEIKGVPSKEGIPVYFYEFEYKNGRRTIAATTTLVKASEGSIPPSFFEIPASYHEVKFRNPVEDYRPGTLQKKMDFPAH